MPAKKNTHIRSKPLTVEPVDVEPVDAPPPVESAAPAAVSTRPAHDLDDEIELEPMPEAPRPQPVATQPIPVAHEPEEVPAAHEPEPIAVAPDPEPIEVAHDPEPITVADEPEPITTSQKFEAPPRVQPPPQAAPRIAAHVDAPASTDYQPTSAVKLFQTAHGRMVMLQRLDTQLSIVLEQRQKLQSELAGLQDEINNEFDRVARNAEDALSTILS